MEGAVITIVRNLETMSYGDKLKDCNPKGLSNLKKKKKKSLGGTTIAVSRCLKSYNVVEKTNQFCVVTIG